MLEILYPLLVIVGLTSLSVVFYFTIHIKNILKTINILLRLKSNEKQDLKEYIQSISISLRDVGVLDIYYHLIYDYAALSYQKDENNSKLTVKKVLDEPMLRGYIELEVKLNKGEQKILNSLILHIVAMQITNEVYLKINIADESFKKIAKLQTYIVHDLKNILQFFSAFEYNLQNLKSDKERDEFLLYMKDTTKPINKKLNSIVTLLKTNQLKSFIKTPIKLRDFFEEMLKLYKLNYTIEGDAMIYVDVDILQSAMENILSNIHQKALLDASITTTITINRLEDSRVEVDISDSGEPFADELLVCEAFYTTKNDGLGIGMYQSAAILQELGATMECKNIDSRAHTIIKFI